MISSMILNTYITHKINYINTESDSDRIYSLCFIYNEANRCCGIPSALMLRNKLLMIFIRFIEDCAQQQTDAGVAGGGEIYETLFTEHLLEVIRVNTDITFAHHTTPASIITDNI